MNTCKTCGRLLPSEPKEVIFGERCNCFNVPDSGSPSIEQQVAEDIAEPLCNENITETLSQLQWKSLSQTGESRSKSGIYIIRRIGSNTVYIGSSIRIGRRISEHRYALRNAIHPNYKLTSCFKSYGLNGMEVAIVEECAPRMLDEKETNWIKRFNSYRNGLNCTPSGDGSGREVSKETRIKIGLKHKGKIISPQQRLLLSIASKNMPQSCRDSQAAKMTGRKRSAEAIIKTANWHRGKKRSANACISMSRSQSKLNVNDVIKIQSMISEGFTYKEIGAIFGVSKQTVSNVKTGKHLKFLMTQMNTDYE